MKKYQSRGYLIISYIIITILILIFFKVINTTKIWIYNEYSILIDSNIINIPVLKKDIKLFRENNYLYYNGKKIHYEIENIIKNDNNILVQLNLSTKIKQNKKNLNSIFLPKSKETIISLIIDSWRSK